MVVEPSGLAALINALIVGFAVLGGSMAAASGWMVAVAQWTKKAPEVLAERVNRGLAYGFSAGAPLALLASIIVGG